MQQHGVDIPLDADHFFELIRLLGLLRGEWFFYLVFCLPLVLHTCLVGTCLRFTKDDKLSRKRSS